MTYDEFKKNLVKVNHGSGVLVSAMTKDYCYVLTAKHNIYDDSNTVTNSLGEAFEISKQDIFSSEVLDASIIILRGIVAPPITVAAGELTHGEPITLGGFPEFRAGNENNGRYLDGAVKDIRSPEFDILCEEFPPQEDVMGISGGGVFLKSTHEWILVGIEFEMAAAIGEASSQIKCYEISIFENIILVNDLPMLKPVFFDDFSELCDSVFALNGTFFDNEKKEFLSTLLRNFSRSRIASRMVSPLVLWNHLKEGIFVKNTPSHCVSHTNLWIAWLELVVISLLMDEKTADDLDMDYIAKMYRNRRLLYSSSTSDWSSFINDIVATKMEEMDENSILFIANNSKIPPNKAIIKFKNIKSDIARTSSANFDFTKSLQQPKPSWIVHLSGLHWISINDKEDEYECVDVMKTIEKIREEYVKNTTGR